MTKADLIVIIATYNGAERLKRVLQGYTLQTDAAVSWKIAIVNNGSTDETSDVIDSFNNRIPIIKFNEQRPGKNAALNKALENISGDLIVFSDDDAIPDRDFLLEWSKILKILPDFDIFGGRVAPLFETAPPSWLDPDVLPFDILYAANKRPVGEVAPGHIFGPNMAVRGKLFQQGVQFDDTIGPNCSNINYTMGSETEFCIRMSDRGARCYFFDGPIVQHIVRPNQMTRSFVMGRAQRMGRAYARLLHDVRNRPKLDLPGLRFLPHYVRQALRWIRKSFARNPERVRQEWHMNIQSGYYAELRDLFSKK